MKRADALLRLEYAGYHNDTKTLVRLYIENRISYPTAQAAFKKGSTRRANGLKCHCRECNPTP